MKEKKRTEGMYIRVSPEFKELLKRVCKNRTATDVIHESVAHYALALQVVDLTTGTKELAQIVGDTTHIGQAKKNKDWWTRYRVKQNKKTNP